MTTTEILGDDGTFVHLKAGLVVWVLGLILLTLSPVSHAQCQPGWLPAGQMPGVDGFVNAIVYLPNGDLIAGGDFGTAGSVAVNHIARWDGTAWMPLDASVGQGYSGSVTSLAVSPNGDLFAGGDFTAGTPGYYSNRVARWAGDHWDPLGPGLNARVSVLAAMPNGDIIAGGEFYATGGGAAPASYIARWNGSAWSQLGTGMNAPVRALLVLPNGDLIAAGDFTAAGGNSAGHIARWDGATWTTLGLGADNRVRALARMPNGDIIAGGTFTAAGGSAIRSMARWNGTTWAQVGEGLSGSGFADVYSLVVMPDGDLFAGGAFTTNGAVPVHDIARWDGTTWSSLGSGIATTYQYDYYPIAATLAVSPSGNLAVGGRFTLAGGAAAAQVASWDGAGWSSLGDPAVPGASAFNNSVYALTSLHNGDLIAGGDFTIAGGVAANKVARWTGSGWAAIGSGINGRVYALTEMPNGDLIAGGSFGAAGGVSAHGIARWDGSSWAPFGSGMNNDVRALAVMPNGDLIAGGRFSTAGGVPANGVARWNGITWAPLGTGVPGQYPYVFELAVLPNGALVAMSAYDINRWYGASWGGLSGSLGDAPSTFTVLPNGDIVAAPYTNGSAAGALRRWSNAPWSDFTSPIVGRASSLAVAPRGDLIAGGTFATAGGVQVNSIARWDGTSWNPLGSGIGGRYSEVKALAFMSDGTLAVGGTFLTAGGSLSTYFARYSFDGGVPSILTGPASIQACAATEVSFSVRALGAAPLTYAWRKDSTPIDPELNPSAATDTLVLANIQPFDTGSFDCIVTGPCGIAASSVATLTVLPAYARACGGLGCDRDLNRDGNADQGDIDYLINVVAGADNPTNIDADFNHDGNVDQSDIDALLNVIAGGACP
ncbi:MAG: hypothetical protein WC718_15290 [Phycisphaerales bacterium]|jgi:WD40 repeat protein